MNVLRRFITETVRSSLLNELRLLKNFDAIDQDKYRVIELWRHVEPKDLFSGEKSEVFGTFITVPADSDYQQITKYLKKFNVDKPKDQYKKDQELVDQYHKKNKIEYFGSDGRYIHVQSSLENTTPDFRHSLLVDHDKHEIVLKSDEKVKDMSRRGPGVLNKANRSYTIPTVGATYDNVLRLKKMLKTLMGLDKRMNGSYLVVGNPRYENMTISDVMKEIEGQDITKSSEIKLVCYHGTSDVRWEKIKTEGLRPGNAPMVYSDLVSGYSDKNVYFTTSIHEAENYATRAVVDDRGKLAVVLKVIIKDPTKIVLDEDNAGWLDNDQKVMNPDGKLVGVHFKDDSWRKWPNADQIMQKFTSKIAKSFNEDQEFGYRGSIPVRDVSVFETYKPASMKKEPSFDEYEKALEKTHVTLTRGEKPVKKTRKSKPK